MPQLSIFILYSTLQHAAAITPAEFSNYWKTTDVTDKVYDYWNHGPIYIPGLQDVFTLTTRPRDIFPPWLTRSTTTYKSIFTEDTITTHIPTTEKATETIPILTTPKSPPTTAITEVTEQTKALDKETEPTQAKTLAVETLATNPTTPTTLNTAEYDYDDGTTDPFSVFLRKFFRVLTVKSLPELSALVEPIVAYLEQLVKDDALKWLGDKLIPYVKKFLKSVRHVLSTAPDFLHAKCYQINNMLINRVTAIETDINGLLNTLDDTYDEAEEEHMQTVLRDFRVFPHTNKTTNEIAHNLVDKVILFPMKRVYGTSKGDILLLMLTDIMQKRDLFLRRYYIEKSDDISSLRVMNRKKKSVNNILESLGQTEGKYQAVRDNIDDINYLMGRLKVSSSETNEYELTVSSIESDERVESVKETNNVYHFRVNEPMKSSEYREYDKSHKMDFQIRKRLRKYQTMPENHRTVNSAYFNEPQWVKTKPNKKYKNTVLVPGLPEWLLRTRLIKDTGLQISDQKKTSKYISYENTRLKDERKLLIITTEKQLKQEDNKRSSHSQHSRKLKVENNKFISKPFTHPKITLTSRHKAENNDRFHGTIKTDYSEFSQNMESQLYKLKSPTQMTYTKKHAMKEITGSTSYLIETNKTPRNVNDKEIINVESEKETEFEDNTSYSECSSKDTETPENKELQPQRHSQGKGRSMKRQKHSRNHRHGHKYNKRTHKHDHKHLHYGKRKYENLKRKYRKLKQILYQRGVYSESNSESEINKKHNDNNTKHADVKVKFKLSKSSVLIDKIDARSANVINDKKQAERNKPQILATTEAAKETLRYEKVNMFLDDFYSEEFNNNNQRKPPNKNDITRRTETTLLDYGSDMRKSLPRNTTDIFEVIEYSDAEKELKENLHDAFRHMDFVNHNESRRSNHDNNNASSMVGFQDPETDVEAVLKNNIYKAFKKL